MTIVEIQKLIADLVKAQGRATPKPRKSWKHFDGREWTEELARQEWEADAVHRFCLERSGEER